MHARTNVIHYTLLLFLYFTRKIPQNLSIHEEKQYSFSDFLIHMISNKSLSNVIVLRLSYIVACRMHFK